MKHDRLTIGNSSFYKACHQGQESGLTQRQILSVTQERKKCIQRTQTTPRLQHNMKQFARCKIQDSVDGKQHHSFTIDLHIIDFSRREKSVRVSWLPYGMSHGEMMKTTRSIQRTQTPPRLWPLTCDRDILTKSRTLRLTNKMLPC